MSDESVELSHKWRLFDINQTHGSYEQHKKRWRTFDQGLSNKKTTDDHSDIDDSEGVSSTHLETGVTFDEKLFTISCFLLSRYGPTIQIAYLISFLLFYLSERVLKVFCRFQYSNPCWIFKRRGFGDAFVGWHIVLLFVLQSSLSIMSLCNIYVDMVMSCTGEERSFGEELVCPMYSCKKFKALVFMPLWLVLALQMSGSKYQRMKELAVSSAMVNWCLRLETISMLLLSIGFWLSESSIGLNDKDLLSFYYEHPAYESITVVPEVSVLLCQYWINMPIPADDYRTSECLNSSMPRRLNLKLAFLVIVVGILQPVFIPQQFFMIYNLKYQPYWFLILPWTLFKAVLFIVRAVYNISSAFISFHFAVIAVERLSICGCTWKIFSFQNPLNESPLIAMLGAFVAIAFLSSTMNVHTLLEMQAFNILFHRTFFSMSSVIFCFLNRKQRVRIKDGKTVTNAVRRLQGNYLCSLLVVAMAAEIVLVVVQELYPSYRTLIHWSTYLLFFVILAIVFIPLILVFILPILDGVGYYIHLINWDLFECTFSFLLNLTFMFLTHKSGSYNFALLFLFGFAQNRLSAIPSIRKVFFFWKKIPEKKVIEEDEDDTYIPEARDKLQKRWIKKHKKEHEKIKKKLKIPRKYRKMMYETIRDKSSRWRKKKKVMFKPFSRGGFCREPIDGIPDKRGGFWDELNPLKRPKSFFDPIVITSKAKKKKKIKKTKQLLNLKETNKVTKGDNIPKDENGTVYKQSIRKTEADILGERKVEETEFQKGEDSDNEIPSTSVQKLSSQEDKISSDEEEYTAIRKRISTMEPYADFKKCVIQEALKKIEAQKYSSRNDEESKATEKLEGQIEKLCDVEKEEKILKKCMDFLTKIDKEEYKEADISKGNEDKNRSEESGDKEELAASKESKGKIVKIGGDEEETKNIHKDEVKSFPDDKESKPSEKIKDETAKYRYDEEKAESAKRCKSVKGVRDEKESHVSMKEKREADGIEEEPEATEKSQPEKVKPVGDKKQSETTEESKGRPDKCSDIELDSKATEKNKDIEGQFCDQEAKTAKKSMVKGILRTCKEEMSEVTMKSNVEESETTKKSKVEGGKLGSAEEESKVSEIRHDIKGQFSGQEAQSKTTKKLKGKKGEGFEKSEGFKGTKALKGQQEKHSSDEEDSKKVKKSKFKFFRRRKKCKDVESVELTEFSSDSGAENLPHMFQSPDYCKIKKA